jgi:hypothetical protein
MERLTAQLSVALETTERVETIVVAFERVTQTALQKTRTALCLLRQLKRHILATHKISREEVVVDLGV